ncbi:MAG: metallophosphoesterase [Planctomycetota bacterium]|nr:metallophosphoesterase [Planctomycetota bacterium]
MRTRRGDSSLPATRRGDDNGVNTTILSEIAAEIINQNAEFVIFTGDLINGNTSSQVVMESQFTTWRNTMQPVYDAGIGVHICRGNHDDDNVAVWNNIFGDLPDNGPAGEINMTYSVTHKNAFVVALDQYVTPHRVNQTWLDAQLAANTNPHIFAFAHETAFHVYHTGGQETYPAERDAFWNSIAGAGGRTYFCGNDHFYNHAHVDDGDGNPDNDVHQLVVATAGAPLYDWDGEYDGNNTTFTLENVFHAKQYGYVLFEIDGLDVTTTWMERTGAGTYEAGNVWSYTAIPEPVKLSLLGVGAFTLIRRRRQKS